MDAGETLRRSRRRAGFSQRELARRAGVPQSVVGKIETGRTTPRVDTLDRLLRAANHRLAAYPSHEVDPQDWQQVLDSRAMTPAERLRRLKGRARFTTKLREAGRRARRGK